MVVKMTRGRFIIGCEVMYTFFRGYSMPKCLK